MTFSVTYSDPGYDNYDYEESSEVDVEGDNHAIRVPAFQAQETGRKRKAEDFPADSGLLQRRQLSAKVIRTDFPRKGSLPPQACFQRTPQGPKKEALHQWLHELPELRTPEQHPMISPTDPYTDDSASITRALPADPPVSEQQQAVNAFKAQMLERFAQAGVPVDLMTGDMAATMANVAADLLAITTAHIYNADAEFKANCMWLIQENSNLKDQLAQTSARLMTIEDSFQAFQKRPMQREIKKEVRELEKKLEKIRKPDVTLESMSNQIKGFEHTVRAQDRTIKDFKSDCADELVRLSKVRREFTTEAKGYKSGRKADLKDLDRKVQDLEEKLENKFEDLEESIAGLSENQIRIFSRQQTMEMQMNNLTSELEVLKEHFYDRSEERAVTEKSQSEFNSAVSEALAELKSDFRGFERE